jgi:uncharacterized protein DUF349
MKLFPRLFRKPAPLLPTLDERIAILSAASPDLIVGAALGSDEEGLRVAAVGRLSDGEALRRIAGLSAKSDGAATAYPPAVERAAQSRIAQLIDAGAVDFSAVCDRAENPSVMFAVAALCKDTSRLPQALASIDDPAQIADLVLNSPSSRLRQLAAERVADPAEIRQLLKQVRDKDKGVYKILKQKHDVFLAEERKAAQFASEVSALCESLERLSLRAYDSLYTPAFEQLTIRWRLLGAEPAVHFAERATQAMDRCREVIAEHLREAEQLVAEQAERQAAREANERARQAAREAAAAQADAEAQLRQEAAALREAEEALRAQKRAEEELLFRRIGGLIRNANEALGAGNTQRAAGLRRAIDEKLSTAPAAPAYVTRQLQQLDDKLRELKQWKDYAVAPKRIELIGEMEALVGSNEEPKVLADRIKSLQEEWRTISKGILSDAPAEWERFHQASQAAYQPCREYFEAQARLRRENLENRKVVLERLAAFETAQNWENTDWRLVASVVREAPQEWRRYFPVDREVNRALQGDFDAAMGRLQARLEACYERNVADKQALIKRARHLLAQEDSRDAIDAVKRLQTQWKETAAAPREQEQSLWNEFRELCDAVYQKRQQAYAEYTVGLEANKEKALALCSEVERVAQLSGQELIEEAAKIPEWRSAFDALGEMPRAEARGLHDRFERAIDLCRAQIAGQHLRDAEQSFANLVEAGRRIQAYGWAVAQDAAGSEREDLRQAAENFIASVQHWPKGGLQAVKEAVAKAGAMSCADSETRERSLRLLCIRAEIRSDAPTPGEDEALRREYQVQRLIRGMGQGVRTEDGDWDAMMLEWVRVGAISPAVHQSLFERFMGCREKRHREPENRATPRMTARRGSSYT